MTSVIFDKHSRLDYKRAQAQIEAKIGKKVFTDPLITFDQWAAEKQIETAAGKTIFTKWSVLDPDLAMRQMEAAL